MGRVIDLSERRRRGAQWLQGEFKRQGLWIRHGDGYQIAEFLRQHGVGVTASTMGHYLRGRRVASPEVCAELAQATNTPLPEVLAHFGYLDMDDLDAYVAFRNRISMENHGELDVA